MFGSIYNGKKVWLSGHTGFKGSWMAEWLLSQGAIVHGYSLAPDAGPALFNQLQLAGRLENEINDIRDAAAVKKSIFETQPDFVFHLAAQPLVRYSYDAPVDTYEVNVMGTVNVLESLRHLGKSCAAVFITTDKCYENREWVHGYREEDALGGFDPYSSSKAAAELAISSWRRSFFVNHPVKIASARAGNVIGGGDWAKDRIIPDCVRSLQKGEAIPVRNKVATRPWQHVLEPLSGYLWLGALLANPQLGRFDGSYYSSAFNFGPTNSSNQNVKSLVEELLKHWPGTWTDKSDPKAAHEAKLLHLTTDKAHGLLGWQPVWNFSETVARTAQWYRTVTESNNSNSARELTLAQIQNYAQQAAERQIEWAKS